MKAKTAVLLGWCFLVLTLVELVQGQVLTPITVDFEWQHNGQYTTGFKLYKGSSPTTLVKAVDIPGASTRKYKFTGTEQLPICFGVSAVGQMGESAVTVKTDTGTDVCLGKPQAPAAFSFSVTSNP